MLTLLVSGCASINGPADPRDPLEGYNRTMFEFNDTVDQYFLKPVAQGYQAITPDPIMKGINNFFSNLDDIIVIFNDLLQLKPMQFASDLGRFIVNSTLGLGGFIDWASDMNMPKHEENFGQTLGYWGVPEGPYFVIPFFGPSTIRDSVGRLVDGSQTDPVWITIEDGYPLEERKLSLSLSVTAAKAIDTRATLLKAENILNEAALDRYSFIREAYLQRSLNLVYDGHPPEEEAEFSENELFDFDETDEPLEKPIEKAQ
ncbi:Outer-membrane-phospholipid-binding lipoprotein MlaA [hydrothermal vent metagenome]|uniref:Outer-membrane-phospholipid-binding lipoprotein MlaA n=1 Tax=hydrothermal vent metagenome TaxID=652676 RepID=A0A3B0WNG0_9ZZZZ